jgi:hypothetical protein
MGYGFEKRRDFLGGRSLRGMVGNFLSMLPSGTISDLRRKREKIRGATERRRQIERLRKKAERLEKGWKESRPKMGRQGREMKSNVTDNESALRVTSHGTRQGYNGQALVDSKGQGMVHAEAFGESQDLHLIPPVLEGAKENMRAVGCREGYFAGKTFRADSNDHSPPNWRKCEEEGLDAYIPDKRFRRRDPRFEREHEQQQCRTDRLTFADFEHHEESDAYRCPQGRVFKRQGKGAVTEGIIERRYLNEGEGCKGCELKARCLKGKKTKRRHLMVPVGSGIGHVTQAMAAKIDSEQGRRIYHHRIAIAEPVFANIRTDKAMNRFTLRGKIKVNIQWLLDGMVHNIGKILNFGFKYAFSEEGTQEEIGLPNTRFGQKTTDLFSELKLTLLNRTD